MTWLGAVTPVGGLLLMAGWAAVLLEGFRRFAPRRRRGVRLFFSVADIPRFARDRLVAPSG